MTEVQAECCKLALKKMMAGGHFDITVVNDVLRITGGIPDGDDYQSLRLLHCMNFRDFSQRMRMEFPALLRRVLESPGMELSITFRPLSRPPDLLPPEVHG